MHPREQICTECALQDLHYAVPGDSISEDGQADGARRMETPFQAESLRGAKAGRWKAEWRVPSPGEGSGATGLGVQDGGSGLLGKTGFRWRGSLVSPHSPQPTLPA